MRFTQGPFLSFFLSAAGSVVERLVANEETRVRFSGGVFFGVCEEKAGFRLSDAVSYAALVQWQNFSLPPPFSLLSSLHRRDG